MRDKSGRFVNSFSADTSQVSYNLVIRNGLVHDGTGAPTGALPGRPVKSGHRNMPQAAQ